MDYQAGYVERNRETNAVMEEVAMRDGVVTDGCPNGGPASKYSVSLYPLDVAVVYHVQSKMHFNTFSAALRYVLRRWADENGLEVRGQVESS